jgi:hypothetical protein
VATYAVILSLYATGRNILLNLRTIHLRTRSILMMALVVSTVCVTGCGTDRFLLSNGTAPPADGSISGNWDFVLSPSKGGSAGETASGSIDEGTATFAEGQFTTSVFIVNASCFTTTPVVPLQGFLTASGGTLTLNSFIVNGQFFSLTTTVSDDGSSMQGSYTVSGGCADGEKGNFKGTRISTVVGNYVGPLTGVATRSIQAALTQSTLPNGDGNFLLAGKATFTGFSCFGSGSIGTPGSAVVSGSSVHATFVTDEAAGSSVLLTGKTSISANQIAVTYQVNGGACNGQTGSGTIVQQ